MIHVVANLYVNSENVNDFISLSKELVEKTKSQDPGCIQYDLYQDQKDSLHFIMIEEWETPEALDNHMKSPHSMEIIPKVTAFNSKPAELTLFDKIS